MNALAATHAPVGRQPRSKIRSYTKRQRAALKRRERQAVADARPPRPQRRARDEE